VPTERARAVTESSRRTGVQSRVAVRIALLAWRDLAHPEAGGSERVVDRLAAGATARGHDVTLFAGGPVGSRTYPVIDTGGRFSQYVMAPVRLRRSVPDPDVVVDVENGIPFFSPLWRRRPVVCLVHHVHTEQWGLYFPKPIAAFGAMLERRAMPSVYRHAQFVAISASTAAALERIGVDPVRLHTITLGTEPVSEVVPEDPERMYLALSRLVPHKRIDVLLDIWEQVRPRIGGTLVIVGDGPERAHLERRAGDGVCFTGFVDESEKQRLLGRAWLLLHPALHEGWGVVVMEAAAAATPTIGFDVVGVRDSVRHGTTGLLAETVTQFAQCWIDLATDPVERARLGEGARAWAHHVSWDRAIDQFLDVLHASVGHAATGRPRGG
jgi:glycosyltransferase involved in cell wall biosynthesis